MKVFIHDQLEICDKSFNKTAEGFLQLQGIIARSGDQNYLRSELGLKDNPDSVITLTRPRESVIDAISIASFMHKPITNNHPEKGSVNATNTNILMKGLVTSVEATDEGKLKADLLVTDADLVLSIINGKRELSAGYSAELNFSDDGKSATQTKIRGNHVAFVDSARCGRECSIFDAEPKARNKKMGMLKIAGVEIEIQDSAIPMVQQVIKANEELTAQVKTLTDSAGTLQGKLDAADDKTKKLEDSQMSDADIVKAAEEIAKLWGDVKLIDKKFDCSAKTPKEIKSAIVVAKIGDSMKDKSDAYIAARFDVLVEDAEEKAKDPLSNSIKKGMEDEEDEDEDDVTNIADAARNRKIARNNDLKTAEK